MKIQHFLSFTFTFGICIHSHSALIILYRIIQNMMKLYSASQSFLGLKFQKLQLNAAES